MPPDLGVRVLVPAIVAACLVLLYVVLLVYLPVRYCVAALVASLIAVRVVPLATGVHVFGLPELFLGGSANVLTRNENVRLLAEGRFFGNFTVLELLLLPAAAIVVVQYLSSKRMAATGSVHQRLLFRAWVLLLTLMAGGFLYAGSRFDVLRELLKWGEVGFVAIATFCYVDGPRRFVLTYWFLLLMIAYMCLSAFAANLAIGDPLARILVTADAGVVLLLPFADRPWARMGLILFFLPMLALAYSRIAWATVLLAAVAFLFWRSPLRRASSRARWVVALGLCVGAVLLVSAPRLRHILPSRVAVTATGLDQSTITRIGFYLAAFEIVKARPLLGVGAGNFKEYLLATRPNIEFWLPFEDLPQNPHSLLVSFLGELGVPGLLLGFAMLFLLWKMVVEARRRVTEAADRGLHPYVWGLGLFLIPLLAKFLVSFIGMDERFPWGVYFGLVASLGRVLPRTPQSGVVASLTAVAR